MKAVLSICPSCQAKVIQGHNICWKCNVYYKEKAETLAATFIGTPRPCPKTWLTEAILITIFWNIFFGIIAIYFAFKVKALYNIRNYEGAEEASRKAGNWIKASIILKLLVILIIPLLIALFTWLDNL